MTNASNRRPGETFPISEQASLDARMDAFDHLTPAIREIVWEAPLPIDPVPLESALRRLGEDAVLSALTDFFRQHHPGYRPLKRRTK